MTKIINYLSISYVQAADGICLSVLYNMITLIQPTKTGSRKKLSQEITLSKHKLMSYAHIARGPNTRSEWTGRHNNSYV